MTSIHYLTGWTVDARHEILDRKLSSWAGGPVLHLVPSRGRVIELESDNRFWPNKRQDTLLGLIYRIFEDHIRLRQFRGCRQADNEIRALIVRKAIEKRSGIPDGLACLNRLLQDHEPDFPGIFRSIAAFFSQLVQNNYQDRFVNDLQERIIRAEGRDGGSGEEIYALESDLAWVFGDFEEIKKEIGVYDKDDVLCSVRDFLGSGDMPCPAGDTDVIIFDGFVHLSRIEEDILSYLFGTVKEVWWLLDYDGQKDDPVNEFMESCGSSRDSCRGMEAYRIFSPMASFMKRLERAGEAVAERSMGALFLNPVARGLYLDGLMRETGDNNLRVRSFPGKLDEIRGMASEIKRLIRDERLDVSNALGRIRIVFPDLVEYAPLVSETFKEYGIPFSLTTGIPLLLHPLSDIFLLIFRLPLNQFKIGDIFRLFSSGLIREGAPAAQFRDDKRILELMECAPLAGDDKKALNSFITGSAGATPRADGLDIHFIDMTARRCGISCLDDHSAGPDGSVITAKNYYDGLLEKAADSSERDSLKREYYRFIIQSAMLYEYLKPFNSLADQDTPHGIEEVYAGLLTALGLPGQLLNAPDLTCSYDHPDGSGIIRRDLKAYSFLKDLVSQSASEMTIENELFSRGKGRDLLSKFYRIFRRRLEKSYILDEEDPNVIRVSQWLEVRGRSFDYVFAGGLTDKGFPLKEERDFICPDICKKAFRAPDSIDMSRYLFSHLLRNCRKGIYLSYPEYSDGKEVRPSNIFTDIGSMIHAGAAPVQDEIPGTSFKWDDSPYLSSYREMLDAGVSKSDPEEKAPAGNAFPLANVIIKDPSLLRGIIRALKAAGSRRALNGLFEYDGLAGKAAGFEAFLRSRKDVFSASQLDTLANCPMRYLFERIYGLKAMEITGPDASPMDMGAHIHRVLSIFFSRLAGQGRNVSDMGIGNAFSQARTDAEEYFRSVPFLDSIEFFDQQKQEFLAGLDSCITRDAVPPREGSLALLIRFEGERFRDRIPSETEYEFGFNGMSSPTMGKIRLRGVIDRFDRDTADKGLVHIYDYKTGAVPPYLLIKKGLSFQLPVYIRALKTCLGAGKITASIYSLKRDNLLKKGPLGQSISYHAGKADGLDITGISLFDRYTDGLMALLEEGRFHHSADMIRCGYCDFKYACHRDERRMDHLCGSGIDRGIYSGMRNLDAWKKAENFTGEWKKIREKMKKAFNIGTASGRKKNYESVLAFRGTLLETIDTLPFETGYIQEIIAEMEDFKNRYLV